MANNYEANVARSAPQRTGLWQDDSQISDIDTAAGGNYSNGQDSGSTSGYRPMRTTSYQQNNEEGVWNELERRRQKRVSSRRALAMAVSQGNLEEVIRITEKARARRRTPINEASRRDGSTALHHAASAGQLEICQWLLDVGGANINAQDKNGETPLYRAVAANHDLIVEILLRGQADRMIPNSTGDYPIHLAVDIGNTNVIAMLVRDTSCLKVLDKAGDNCLARAVRSHNISATHQLCELLPILSLQRNSQGRTPYDLAAFSYQLELCDFLSQGQTGTDWPHTSLLKVSGSSERPSVRSTDEAEAISHESGSLSTQRVDTQGWLCITPWTLMRLPNASRTHVWVSLVTSKWSEDGAEEAQLLAGDWSDGSELTGRYYGTTTSPERSASDVARYRRAIEYIRHLTNRNDRINTLWRKYEAVIGDLTDITAVNRGREAAELPPRRGSSRTSMLTTNSEPQSALDRTPLNLDHANDDSHRSSVDWTHPSISGNPVVPPQPYSVPHPYWQPDEEAVNCLKCHRQFSFFIRRHHCRRCGLVFCDRCSSRRAMMNESEVIQDPFSTYPGSSLGDVAMASRSGPQRVCDDCYHQIRGPVSSPWPLFSSTSLPNGLSDILASVSLSSQQNLASSGELNECPVCGTAIHYFSPSAREEHLRQCLEGDSARSKSLGGRYLVYRIPESSPIIGEECPICFIEFSEGEKAARLSCLCNYHQVCIEAWFATGNSCPVHVR